MLSVLSNRTYRHLFAAQVVALVGTGLATVALGLLALSFSAAGGAMVIVNTVVLVRQDLGLTDEALALTLAALGAVGLAAGVLLWPRHDAIEIAHGHDDLPADHPHIAEGARHSHAYVIDDLHPHWPTDRDQKRTAMAMAGDRPTLAP